MNFLAHIYLSGNNDQLKIGNFIADMIKGNKYKLYPLEIQKGIKLHRHIDSFTDTHDIVKKSKKRLHSRYKHYDGVIIDVLYDHFLAKNWSVYSKIPLKEYTQNFYSLLHSNYNILPEKTKNFLPYMEKDDWLYSYSTFKGIENVLIGLNKRTQHKSKMHLAIEDLHLYYTELENDFTTFFTTLCDSCKEKIKALDT